MLGKSKVLKKTRALLELLKPGQQFVKEHPGTALAGLAGAAGLGGLAGAGIGAALDKKSAAKKKIVSEFVKRIRKLKKNLGGFGKTVGEEGEAVRQVIKKHPGISTVKSIKDPAKLTVRQFIKEHPGTALAGLAGAAGLGGLAGAGIETALDKKSADKKQTVSELVKLIRKLKKNLRGFGRTAGEEAKAVRQFIKEHPGISAVGLAGATGLGGLARYGAESLLDKKSADKKQTVSEFLKLIRKLKKNLRGFGRTAGEEASALRQFIKEHPGISTVGLAGAAGLGGLSGAGIGSDFDKDKKI